MKNIIVVTGASSGMGLEFAKQISKNNIDEMWVIARDKEILDNLDLGIKTISLCLDLSKNEEIEKYNKKLEKEKPNIVILANCAGFGKFDHSENISLDVKLNMIDLNVKGYVSMIDYSLNYMHEGSKIMNIVSDSSFQPVPYVNTYAATKAFLLSYSRALNVELKYHNIHVLSVCPFWVQTNFFKRAVVEEHKDVIIKYTAMYNKEDVIKRAIKDLYSSKDMSVYGFINKSQWILAKILPHKLVMWVWMKQQKFDGTRDIRK